MKSVRKMAIALIVVGLALVATPTWADEPTDLATAWEQLIDWIGDWVAPDSQENPGPDVDEDEALSNPEPYG